MGIVEILESILESIEKSSSRLKAYHNFQSFIAMKKSAGLGAKDYKKSNFSSDKDAFETEEILSHGIFGNLDLFRGIRRKQIFFTSTLN